MDEDRAEARRERIQVLIRALGDQHVSVKWNATRELARLGAAAKEAVPALTALLADRDGTTVLWAHCALARIEGDAPAHLPAILDALTDKKIEKKTEPKTEPKTEQKRVFPGMAAAALAELGTDALPAVPALIGELEAPHADDRWSAASALAVLGSAAREAVPGLSRALREDEDEKVRWYAAYALSEIGPDSAPAVLVLTAALDDPDEDVRGYAARALGRIGQAATDAIPRLRELLPLEEGTVQAEMIRALSLLENPA